MSQLCARDCSRLKPSIKCFFGVFLFVVLFRSKLSCSLEQVAFSFVSASQRFSSRIFFFCFSQSTDHDHTEARNSQIIRIRFGGIHHFHHALTHIFVPNVLFVVFRYSSRIKQKRKNGWNHQAFDAPQNKKRRQSMKKKNRAAKELPDRRNKKLDHKLNYSSSSTVELRPCTCNPIDIVAKWLEKLHLYSG